MSKDNLCIRCNYAYATTSDEGLPVCEGCKSKRTEEPTRTCPVDQTEMKKIFVQNVMIDKCPKCSGIWLDGDEVNLLNGLAKGSYDNSWSKKETEDNGSSGKFWKGFIVGAILSKD